MDPVLSMTAIDKPEPCLSLHCRGAESQYNVEGALKPAYGVRSLKGQSQPEILYRIQELIVEENMSGARLLC